MLHAKRFLLIVPLLLLSACGTDEQSQQQADAAERFQQAMAHLANASSGYIATSDSGAQDVDRYRVDQLNKAASTLSGLTRTGTGSQRLAVGLALADVHAELGRTSLSDTLAGIRQHNRQSKRVLSALSSAVYTSGQAQTYRQQNTDASLTELNGDLTDARAHKTEIVSRIRETNRKIEGRQSNQADLKSSRGTLVTQAADLHSKRFSSTGDERFALHLKYAQTTRQADALAAEIEQIENELGVLRDKLAEQEQLLALIEAQTAGIEKAIASIQGYNQQNLTNASEAGANAARHTQTLVTQIAEIDESYDAGVRQPYAQAIEHLTASVEAIQSVGSQARGKDRDFVQLALVGRMIELAAVQRQASAADTAYAELMTTVWEQAETALPAGDLATLQQVKDNAAIRSQASRAGAIETLQAAVEPLDALGQNMDDNALVALHQLSDVYGSLSDLTGNVALRDKLTEVQARIDELTRNDEDN